MHFGQNGSVDHGFQEAAYGGQRGTEVVGDIGHKFLLVIFSAGNFTCHKGNAGGQVSDFIFTFYLKFIAHIAGGILLCGIGDFFQGNIDNFREKNQDDHG